MSEGLGAEGRDLIMEPGPDRGTPRRYGLGLGFRVGAPRTCRV